MARERILISERSLPDERLTLIRFGCNNCDDWKFDTSKGIADFHNAIQEHGKHNLKIHPLDSTSLITFIYKVIK